MEDLHSADVIFMATHSQGSIISTHLLAKLIQEGHILTPRNIDILTSAAAAIVPGGVAGTTIPTPASSSRTQKICCLALCGIHLGPLRYLKTSSLLGQYIQVDKIHFTCFSRYSVEAIVLIHGPCFPIVVSILRTRRRANSSNSRFVYDLASLVTHSSQRA